MPLDPGYWARGTVSTTPLDPVFRDRLVALIAPLFTGLVAWGTVRTTPQDHGITVQDDR